MTDVNAQVLLDICRQRLGSGARLVARQVGSNGTQVIRVATAGGQVVVKRHRTSKRHAQEIHAYANWTPTLGDQAPRLLGVDHEVRAIILSAAAGSPMASKDLSPAEEKTVFAAMGDALRRFHAAAPARDDVNMAAWLAERGSRWLDAARHLVPAGDRITIKAHLRALEGLVGLPTVPCHLDFTPRNVLVGPGGITVVDFEHARYDLAARDLVRLAARTWTRRAGSRSAFLHGYGALTDTDDQIIEHCQHLDRLTAAARAAGVELGDPVAEDVVDAVAGAVVEHPGQVPAQYLDLRRRGGVQPPGRTTDSGH
jgi:Ser/Thr protein kinase RdoA (MazF antagonist)